MSDLIHGDSNEPQPAMKIGNLQPDKISTNERRVYPLIGGTGIVPALHIGQVYDQFEVDAPTERPSKK